MTILYFTTTGNSLYVAKHIGGKLRSIPTLMMNREFGISDPSAIGIVTPTYFGRIPSPVTDFLSRSTLDAPYLFGILTYGSTPGLAAQQLKALVDLDYITAIEMVDNFFPMFDIEKQTKKKSLEKVDEKLKKIADSIYHREKGTRSPGLYDRVADTYMRLFPFPEDVYRKFHVLADRCNQCGVCTQVCPIGNITIRDSLPPTIGEKCLLCGGCYHNCPNQAIRFTGEKSRYQYRHPSISLKEIISSNSKNEQ